MRHVLGLVLCVLLQGCWFIYIPGSAVSSVSDSFTGAEGDHCVREASQVGDRIRAAGKVGTIKSLSGTSSRCKNPEFPIRARLVIEE